MSLETREERVKLLKVGLSERNIEFLYLKENNYSINRNVIPNSIEIVEISNN